MNEKPENEIKFNVKLVSDDYKHFNLHNARKSFIGGALLYYFAALAMLLLIYSRDGYDPLVIKVTLMIAAPACAVASLLVVFILYLSIRFRSKRIFKTDRLLQQEYTYLIDIDGIRLWSESGNGIVKWEDIYKVKETRYSFFVFLATNKAFIIPKRSLTDVIDTVLLRRTLFENLPTRKLRLRKK